MTHVTAVTWVSVTAVTPTPVIDVTHDPVTGGTARILGAGEDVPRTWNLIPRGPGGGDSEMAEKKVAPKAPAAKSAKSETKAAATRVTKKKLRKKIR